MSESNKTDTSLDETYSAAWSGLGEGVGIDDDSLPSAADFLASHPDASLAERLEVLLADQMLRWRRGCPKLIGDYLAEHPTSTGEPETILKLIQGEFLVLSRLTRIPIQPLTRGCFPNCPKRSTHSARLTGGYQTLWSQLFYCQPTLTTPRLTRKAMPRPRS